MQLMIVVALGVGVRLGVLALAPDLEIWADGRNYVFQAAAWERFGVYLGSKSFLWPPGYAAVLRMALAWFAEHGILATRLAQIAASAIVGASIVAIGRRVFSDRAAWVAGLLWAIHLPLVAFTHLLRPETFFLAVLAPGVLLSIRVLDSPERDGASGLRPRSLPRCRRALEAGCSAPRADDRGGVAHRPTPGPDHPPAGPGNAAPGHAARGAGTLGIPKPRSV